VHAIGSVLSGKRLAKTSDLVSGFGGKPIRLFTLPLHISFVSVVLPNCKSHGAPFLQQKMGSTHENDHQNCENAPDDMAASECKPPVYCCQDIRYGDCKDVRKESGRRLEIIKENDGNCRDFQLFRHWVDRASGVLSVYCSCTAPGVEHFDRSKHAFLVEVQFDFNQKNFRPVKTAEVFESDPGTDDFVFGTNGKQGGDIVRAKIRYREFELVIPVFLTVAIRHSRVDGGSVGDYPDDEYGALGLQHKIFNGIHLESSVFRRWANLERENRRKSYQHLLSEDDFVQFVIYAYHLPCCRPRYSPASHVLAVTVTFGFELGELDRPHNFFILPREHAFEKLRRWYHLTPRAIKAVEKKCVVDTDERTVDMAVILLAHVSRKLSVHHVKVSRWKILCKKKLNTLPCDRKAMALFEHVQTNPTLTVKSPDLNEGQ